jgi:hypothetical protein
MLGQYTRTQAQRFVRRDGAVCPHIQRKLVVVRNIAYTGTFHRKINLYHRCKDGIYGNQADGLIGAFIFIGTHITMAFLYRKLDVKLGVVAVQRRYMQFRVHNLDVGVELYVLGMDDAFAGFIDYGYLRFLAFTVVLDCQAF